MAVAQSEAVTATSNPEAFVEAIGESFLFEIPAHAMACGRSFRVPAWRTETPGLIVSVVPGGQYHGIVITHEASGLGLTDMPVDFERMGALLVVAKSLGGLGVDWREPELPSIYETLANLSDEVLHRFEFMTTFSRTPSRDAAKVRSALKRTAELLRSRRTAERSRWN